jgi:hypothetical protein
MDQSAPDILQRLEACELELQAARGYIKALECGLHAVIASHPAPDELAALWAHVLPEVADTHGGTGTALFNAALRQALATLTVEIDGATRRDESDN